MDNLETLQSEPIYTNGQAASLDPFPSVQGQASYIDFGHGSKTMMLNPPTAPRVDELNIDSKIDGNIGSYTNGFAPRSASRRDLLNKGLVYYEDFEGRFQESKVSNFLLQAGYSNTNGNGFEKVGVTEFDNSYAEVDLLTGSAAYGNGSASLELKEGNSRVELGQSNQFNETHFSGEGDHLWVGASIKIDPTYTRDGSSRIIQLKRNTKPGKGPAGPPPFSVFYDGNTGNAQGVISQRLAGETGKSKGFSLGKLEPGKWYDFVIHTYWSSTNKGHTELWLNGNQKIDYTGPNVTAFHANDKNTRTSVQIGVYNSGIAKNDSKVHLDEVRIAANDGFYDIVKPGGMLNSNSPSTPSNPNPPTSASKVLVEAESSLVNFKPGGYKDGILKTSDASGGKAYGMFHTNSAATFEFRGETGIYNLALRAKADLYKGEPSITVQKNSSSEKWRSYIANETWKTTGLDAPAYELKKGDKITLKFDNDLYGGSKGKDRNLYLDYLEFVPLGKAA